MKEFIINSNSAEIPGAIDFLRAILRKNKIKRKHIIESLLAAEVILEKICSVADEGSQIKISVSGIFSDYRIKYSATGGTFTVADIQRNLLFSEESASNHTVNMVMNGLFEKLFINKLVIKCENGIISVSQYVDKSPYKSLIFTISSLILGILTGLFIQYYANAATSEFMTKNIFAPIYNVLINALKMIVAPLVFFSIASSIAEFTDLKELGRIALKLIAIYIFTSIIAILVGLFTYSLFPIGNPELAQAVNVEAASSTLQKSSSAIISIRDTLIDIVPSDIITPFQKQNMLQIIFLAVCIGLSSATLSKSVPAGKQFIQAMNMIFSKITEKIVFFMPLLVFCSMAKMMSAMNINSLLNLITWIPVIYIGDLLMISVYLLLLMKYFSPIDFINKYYPAMIAAFTLSSSNAALPSSIKQCKKLGISEKIYSFSLPLGATINMDGSCITLMISALFFARIYQIPTTASMIVQLFIAIIVLSVGSPGVPGGNLVCLTLLIPQIGIPAEAISLVIGLYPLISMMQTMANVTGDAVVTTIVASSENLLESKATAGNQKT